MKCKSNKNAISLFPVDGDKVKMATFPSLSARNNNAEQEEISDLEVLDYKYMISTLPKEERWGISPLYQYQGCWLLEPMLEGLIIAQKRRYEHDPSSNVLLVSYYKSGTTWLKALLFAITTRTKNHSLSNHPLLTFSPHYLVPQIEFHAATNPLNPIPGSTALLGSHLPFKFLPDLIKHSERPIIYVYRNSKDVLVSLWHFVNNIRRLNSLPDLTLEEGFDLFCNGISSCGCYWDHLLGYWEASLKMPQQRILFVSYEELKAEPIQHVKRIARFVGHPFSVEEEKDGIVESIIDLCSFKKLSSLEINESAKPESRWKMSHSFYFRKGEKGDHQNYLTREMIERLDAITAQKWKDVRLSIN